MTKCLFESIITLLSTTQGYVMTHELLTSIISDPIDGPYEGEDFWIDPDGTIQIADNNATLAATIMRKTNNSGYFDSRLVKIGQRGDSILLGFDTLLDAEPVFVKRIGFKGDTLAEVKATEDKRFCLYLNKKRVTRMFKKLTAAKTYVKKIDRELQEVIVEPENFEE